MHDTTARVFSGLGVLVVVWIVVYWTWPVKDPAAEFSAGPLSDVGEISEPLINPEPVGEGRGTERFTPEPPAPSVVSESPAAEEAASGAGTGVIPPGFDEYVVRRGDNFERISLRVYGTRRHAMAIGRSNPLLDPRKLREGQSIRVPTDPANIQGLPVEGGDEPAGGAEPAGQAPTIEYTVKRGDSLGQIARSFYGSITHTDFLFEANRDRLASKDDLRLGQVLLIPPLPVSAGDE